MAISRPHLAAVQSFNYIVGSRTLDGVLLVCIGVAIWVGWALVVSGNWSNIVQSTTRLGYLAGDCALLAPGCIASGLGLLTDQPWGPPTLLIAVGAAAFDLTHTFIFLAETDVPKFHDKPLAPFLYAALILVTLGLLGWIAWRAIWFATNSHPPWYLWVLSLLAAVVLVVIVVLGVRAARKPRPAILSSTPLET